jgi:ABC-2 type transport system ATP-binding protein
VKKERSHALEIQPLVRSPRQSAPIQIQTIDVDIGSWFRHQPTLERTLTAKAPRIPTQVDQTKTLRRMRHKPSIAKERLSTVNPVGALELRDLTKYYGNDLGIDGVTFDVSQGETFGFLGPNGAGKTTTMRLLLGLIKPTRGTASILGKDISQGPPTRESVGYLPGTLELYENLTGGEFLNFFARLRKRDCRKQIDSLSKRFDLDLTRHIHDLSKGNRQKLGVVQAFMHEPDLLLLDEPTSGLDPLVQREFAELVRETTARGGTLLLSSHVMSEVELLTDRVAIINVGKLVLVERITDLKARAVRSVELDFPTPIDPKQFEQLASVKGVTTHRNRIICKVSGSENELLRLAVSHNVQTVMTHEPDLNEIFLGLIGANANHVGAK